MALTLTRDLRFPAPGDTVTIQGVFTVGTRYRCRLTDKPVDSALPIWDAALQNYLDNNQLIPDVPGRYTIVGVEETVTINVPHFSNDHGGTLKKGVEQVTINGTTTYYVSVVSLATVTIGFEPDTTTLQVWGGVDDYLGGSTSGAITRFVDQTKCPRLVDGTSDMAKIAMASDMVARQVAEIGGYGNETYKYGTRVDQTEIIRSYDTIVDPAILTSFGWLINRLNDHIENQAVMIHGAADAANVVTAGPALSNDEPSQRALLNDILTKLSAHVAIGGGGVHSNADSIAVTALGALAALPAGSTEAARTARTIALFDIMDAHFTRKWISINPVTAVGVTLVHDTTADNHLNYTTLYPIYDDATRVAAANAMKTEYNLHRAKVVVLAALYHAIPGDVDNTFNEALPVDRAGYIKAVGTALTVMQFHVTNYNPVTGATEVYHTAPDWGSRTDFGGPTDLASAINCHEALNWALAKHANTGPDTHGALFPGRTAIRPYGVEAIHHAFRSVSVYTGTTVNNNENAALARFVQCRGFKKG